MTAQAAIRIMKKTKEGSMANGNKYESAAQVAKRLRPLGNKQRPYTTHTILLWCRMGYFPGAKKIRTVTGHFAWRIPAGALPQFFKRG